MGERQITKHRIYAKLVGYILPDNETFINHCVIKKMSFKEQKRRKFFPLRNERKDEFNDRWYKSYITYPSNADFRELKTKYVIYTDIEEPREINQLDAAGYYGDVNAALGVAVRRFDKVIGSLCLCTSDLMFKKTNRYLDTIYDYQICRIYELKDGKEVEAKKPFMGGWGGMINFPCKKFTFGNLDFDHVDSTMIDRMLKSRNVIFVKSLRYLLKGVKGKHLNVPMEKNFIDYTKSIELIVDSFKGRSFNKRLKKACKVLDIPEENRKEIMEIWRARCSGDFAHANKKLSSLNLPPQFPEPSDSEFRYFNLFGNCSMLVQKYFVYIDNEIEIRINDSRLKHMINSFSDQLITTNMGDYYCFYTEILDRRILVPKIKKEISKEFGCKYKDIKLRSFKKDTMILKISDRSVIS